MRIEEIKNVKEQLNQIAAKYGISKMYVFGSVARGDDSEISDVDFLVEMDDNASALGIGGFQFEVQQLLGLEIDVIPTFALPSVDDQDFVQNIQSEAVPL
jgi:hypothetical protein